MKEQGCDTNLYIATYGYSKDISPNFKEFLKRYVDNNFNVENELRLYVGSQVMVTANFPDLKMVAVEPAESAVMSGGEAGVHGIQGIGDGSKFLVNMDCVDYISIVSTEDAKARARELAKSHGLFVGISAGANILAAERFIEERKPKGIVVTFLCDRGDRYFSCL